MHKTNAAIVTLAELIGRTPSSLALKQGNFTSFDSYQKLEVIMELPKQVNWIRQFGMSFFISGMRHCSKAMKC
jgi:hypothetical protein